MPRGVALIREVWGHAETRRTGEAAMSQEGRMEEESEEEVGKGEEGGSWVGLGWGAQRPLRVGRRVGCRSASHLVRCPLSETKLGPRVTHSQLKKPAGLSQSLSLQLPSRPSRGRRALLPVVVRRCTAGRPGTPPPSGALLLRGPPRRRPWAMASSNAVRSGPSKI